jgi:hypothetical protein
MPWHWQVMQALPAAWAAQVCGSQPRLIGGSGFGLPPLILSWARAVRSVKLAATIGAA